MKRTLLILAVLAACAEKTAEPPPPPLFTGSLSVARIMTSGTRVKVMEPWSTALPKLEARLGKPMKIDEDGDHKWAAMDGDTCAYLEVRVSDGERLGKKGRFVTMLQAPMKVEKDGPPTLRDDCLEIAGKPSLPEDPDAAPPPTDGIVAPADLERLALAGRSKWEGKKVKVTGRVTRIGGVFVGIDGANCLLAKDADAALLDKTVTAEGTVRIQRTLHATGSPWRVELADCTVTEN